MAKPKNPSILYMGSFPPRECGIATFTEDLTSAIDKEYNPAIKSKILAINDNGTSIYNYPRKVIMQINETEMEDYINRAYEINRCSDIKLVNIQHEYGLFGGGQGEYLMPFLELLKKPFIITMHTVLPHPGEKMKKVGRIISEKAAGVVVMNHTAKEVLADVYNIKKNKITVIPHGVHNIAFPSKKAAKKKLNLKGRIVLSTFGMISRDKGIEYAIEALPDIIQEYPNVIYLILGATHPVVRRQEGEKYRNKLKKLVVKHKLQENVKFYNKYLELHELIDFLKATDIYLYPMLSPEQASSGSLTYAMSCGCPAIATKSQYAQSVLNNERGRLVGFKNSKEIRDALFELIPNKALRKEMKKNTYFFTRHMTWQNVALSYFKLFNENAKIIPRDKDKLPAIKLDYIKNLTNNFGIIQFANHTKPDPHSGFCLDDNARALIGCTLYYQSNQQKANLNLIKIFLNYIKFSQKSNGKFTDFVSYNKTRIQKIESDDSFGRAIWALGCFINNNKMPENMRKQAKSMFKKTLKWVGQLKSLRAISFTILGLAYFSQTPIEQLSPQQEAKDKQLHAEVINLIKRLSNKLIKKYEKETSQENKKNWLWFEDCLTYSNYKLPEALFRSYEITKNPDYIRVAKESINFLNSITFEKEKFFSPIGQDGWYFVNGKRAYYDQQPEDAATATEALIAAYQVTKEKNYLNQASLAFEWFLGKNHLNQMVYDEATGGSYDGLGKYSLNFNQGAESSLSYFLARLAMEKITKN